MFETDELVYITWLCL